MNFLAELDTSAGTLAEVDSPPRASAVHGSVSGTPARGHWPKWTVHQGHQQYMDQYRGHQRGDTGRSGQSTKGISSTWISIGDTSAGTLAEVDSPPRASAVQGSVSGTPARGHWPKWTVHQGHQQYKDQYRGHQRGDTGRSGQSTKGISSTWISIGDTSAGTLAEVDSPPRASAVHGSVSGTPARGHWPKWTVHQGHQQYMDQYQGHQRGDTGRSGQSTKETINM